MTLSKVARGGATLRQARNHLLEHGEMPIGTPVDDIVARSWTRSLDAGLMPAGPLPEPLQLSGFQITHALERQQELLAHARPVMEYLYGQTRNSDSMVILADERGLLLQTMGDPGILSRAQRVALSPGASWGERYRGTNAIGTALAEAAPVVVNGPEHFLERNGFLTCAAAPVAAPNGRLLGILDISGDHRKHHPHTFCLVRSAAQMIENGLFKAIHGANLQIRFHSLSEGIGTLAEGVAALTEEGYLIGANRAALDILKLIPADLGRVHLENLFQIRLDNLFDWAMRYGDEILPITRSDGSRFFVRIQPGRVVRSQSMSRPEPAVTDALSALNTGCARVRSAIDKARKILDKPIPVLLQGESGVGKEVFARAMHDSGPRHNQPFVAVDCSALPENLVEAELFGYLPGAFTGARRGGSPGRIREAHGGTLFLDEIGDMPLAMQSRLLRVLQERQITPLGGGKAVFVDFMLICATHRDLKIEMEAGRFRADLYYRINGLGLKLPALRERSDFQTLLHRLVAEMAPGRGLSIEPSLVSALSGFHWPGNIRQLVNAVRTACALIDEDERMIGWIHLPDDLSEALRQPTTVITQSESVPPENLKELSKAAIAKAVELSNGNMSEAARRLGISRNTLYRKIAKCTRRETLR